MSAAPRQRRPSSEEFFGADAARKWHEAFDALRRFAQADGCPLGADIFAWFCERSAAFQDAPTRPVN